MNEVAVVETSSSMPIIGWVALAAFIIFLGYRIYKSKQTSTTGSGGSSGSESGGGDTHHR